jgi:hypothetical protein
MNCNEASTGTEGWNKLQDTMKFRQGFSKASFSQGVLKHVTNAQGKVMSTVTFPTRIMRDLFHRSVEKKDSQYRFYFSYPLQYRAANKQFKTSGVLLRDAGYATEISIDESSLIMYLKYRQRTSGKIQYEYQISDKFDPFDKLDSNALKTNQTKALTGIMIMIKPKYGDNHSPEVLKEFITTYIEKMKQDGTPIPTHTQTYDKVIMLQFSIVEEVDHANDILSNTKSHLMGGTFTHHIL